MNNNRLWVICLIIIGTTSLIFIGTKIMGIVIPDALTLLIGILEVVTIPVFTYTTIKKVKQNN